MNKEGKYTRIVKVISFVTGTLVLWASINFSQRGFGLDSGSEFAWVGWCMALAATVSQFIFNSEFRKLNWTILVLGTLSYIYSIYTNILGYHSISGGEGSMWKLVNISIAIFMDVFPETAIAWAVGESRVGDLIGNLIKSAEEPENLISKGNTQQVQSQPTQRTDLMGNLPQSPRFTMPTSIESPKNFRDQGSNKRQNDRN